MHSNSQPANDQTAAKLMVYSLLLFGLVNCTFLVLHFHTPRFLWITLSYNFMTILSPLVWLGCGLYTLRYCRRDGKKHPSIVTILFFVLAAGAFCVRIYATSIEPNLLLLREVTITSEKVTKPWKILHITDFQSDIIGTYEERAVAKINNLHADLVLFTGDLIQPNDPTQFLPEFDTLNVLFGTVNPPLGFIGVLGDIDLGIHIHDVRNIGSMKLLNNQDIVVRKGQDTLRIMGLSCFLSKMQGNTDGGIKKLMRKTSADEFTVMLGHSPDYILAAQNFPIDLCLAGHTHGGQVRIPFWGPLMTLSKVPRQWSRGFRSIGQTRLNVSAGIGCERADWLPCIRFNCPSEMTLITIAPP